MGAMPVIALALACAGGIGANYALAAPAANQPTWVISVNGETLGAAQDQDTLNDLYEAVVDSLSLIHI